MNVCLKARGSRANRKTLMQLLDQLFKLAHYFNLIFHLNSGLRKVKVARGLDG
jgi:hypothetical protein